jgi:hypothetical protein
MFLYITRRALPQPRKHVAVHVPAFFIHQQRIMMYLRPPYFFFILLFFFLAQPTRADIKISGVVRNAQTHEPLQFASVRVEGSVKGTTTDKQGRFTLYLDKGRYTLITSYIGFGSDSREVTVTASSITLTIELAPTDVQLPGVTITPGDNPALEIIRQAIAAKERRKERLENYSVTSHSKVVVDVEKMTGVDVNNMSAGDSTLTAVLETQTDAYWAKPNHYKEIIKARKQTAFIPSQNNLLISSFFIIDFSADLLRLSDKARIVGPISSAGLRNYDYTLKGSVLLDSTRLYMIDIRPLSENDPLLTGTLYIADKSFALAMVDVHLNDAALPSFFQTLAFKQHFRRFEDDFWMPVDVVVDAAVEFSMIVTAKLRIEALSILQDYAINRQLDADFFDRTRIKVLKEADERDSTYWSENQKIPNTLQEIAAYQRADSIKARMDSARNSYGFSDALFGKSFRYGEKTSLHVPGVLSLYRYNRVQGHVLAPSLSLHNLSELFPFFSYEAGYGFSDRRWDHSLRASVWAFTGSVFDRSSHVDDDQEFWSEFPNTVSNLLWKYDHRDYDRVRGWSIGARADALRLFPLSFSVNRQTYTSVAKTTDWSITRASRPFRDNPAVNDGAILSGRVTMSFDNRDFIDNAGDLRRMGGRNHVPGVSFTWNEADLSGETFTFLEYAASLRGSFDLGRIGTSSYRVSADVTNGKLPAQRLDNLPGSVDFVTRRWRFRTLDFREFGGDRRAMLFIDHDFDDQLFRWLHLPLLERSSWGLHIFASMGWTSMTRDTRAMQTVAVQEAKAPFYEAGFGLDRVFLLFSVDVAWRLNHFREGRNFFIGLSAPFLF